MSLPLPLRIIRPPQIRLPTSVSPFFGLHHRNFTTYRPLLATYNQVLRGIRKHRTVQKTRSPALIDRPELKGVCLRVGTTKPKKPNSGERKTARVRLSTGKIVTAYIPGEGALSIVSLWVKG